MAWHASSPPLGSGHSGKCSQVVSDRKPHEVFVLFNSRGDLTCDSCGGRIPGGQLLCGPCLRRSIFGEPRWYWGVLFVALLPLLLLSDAVERVRSIARPIWSMTSDSWLAFGAWARKAARYYLGLGGPPRVFLSGTHSEFAAAREELGRILRGEGRRVVVAELDYAWSDPNKMEVPEAIEACGAIDRWVRDEVRRCDVFLLLIGHRIGSMNDRFGEVKEWSWIEMEHIWATDTRHPKKILTYDLRPQLDASGPSRNWSREHDALGRNRVDLLVEACSNSGSVRVLRRHDDLRRVVASDLNRALTTLHVRWMACRTLSALAAALAFWWVVM